MKRVIVTGASGFIGRAVLQPLLDRDFEVIPVCTRVPQGFLPAGLPWRECDLCEASQVKCLFEELRPMGLIHLAWVTTPGEYWTSTANLSWLSASLTLIRSFADAGGRRLVVAGTSAEYAWGDASPLDEFISPLQPQKLYGKCKNALREILEEWAPQAGISCAWGRIFNVFGPYETSGRLVPKVIASLLADEPMSFDSGVAVRDFLHVEDAGEAFARLFDSPITGPVNIANGEATSIRDLLSVVTHALNKEGLVLFDSVPDRPEEYPIVLATASRIRQEVGWQPAAPLEQRIRETCQWWQENHIVTNQSK